MRQVAENVKEAEERAWQELAAEAQRAESQLGNLAPVAASKAREAEAARQAGEYEEAEALLGEAEETLAQPARDAQALTAALAVLHEVAGDAGEARRWAEVSLGYDQPPQRVDDLRRIIAGEARPAPGTMPTRLSRAR
jgi:hypothetical protein